MTINLGTLVWIRRALLVRFYTVTTYMRYEAKYTISRTLSQPQGESFAVKKEECAAAYYAGFVAVNCTLDLVHGPEHGIQLLPRLRFRWKWCDSGADIGVRQRGASAPLRVPARGAPANNDDESNFKPLDATLANVEAARAGRFTMRRLIFLPATKLVATGCESRRMTSAHCHHWTAGFWQGGARGLR
jgi:hypothetical protein